MTDQTHPDSPSGQPYSAPGDHSITDPKANVDAGFRYVAPRKAWGGNADPRNLNYEGLRYLGAGYEQPNDTPWDGRPPPVNESWTTNSPVWTQQPGSSSPSGSGGKKRSWFARHKIWTGLLAAAAVILVLGIISAVIA